MLTLFFSTVVWIEGTIIWELPEKEKRIAELDKEIDRRYAELSALRARFIGLQRTLKLAEDCAGDIAKSLYVAKRDADM